MAYATDLISDFYAHDVSPLADRMFKVSNHQVGGSSLAPSAEATIPKVRGGVRHR